MTHVTRRLLALLAVAVGLAGLVLPVAVPIAARAAEVLHGRWTLSADEESHNVQLSLTRGERGDGSSWTGRSIAIDRLSGLGESQLEGAATDVRFQIVRDAGTFTCEGRVGGGEGGGLYALALDERFADGLARRGIGRPTSEQQARLAYADVGFALLDALDAEHYPRPDLAQLVLMGDHGVDLDYLRGMSGLGHHFASVSELVTARDHGVDPRYIRGMREAGYDGLSFRELLESRDHGVDPRYIAGLRAAGIHGLTIDELRTTRDHGVDPHFIDGLARLGYHGLSLDELVRARDHGVDPHFIDGMVEAGYAGLPLVDLVRARDHGVDSRFARRYNERAGRTVSLERLIRARDTGDF
jgi:hypothetical protein